MASSSVSPAQVEAWFHQAASGQATEALQAWINQARVDATQRAHSLHVCLQIFSVIPDNNNLTTRFYALTTLDQWQPFLDTAQRAALRQVLLQLHHNNNNINNPHNNNNGDSNNNPSTDPHWQVPFFRNKVAAVLVETMVQDSLLVLHQQQQSQQSQPLQQNLLSWIQPTMRHLSQVEPTLFLKTVATVIDMLIVDRAHQQDTSMLKDYIKSPQSSTTQSTSSLSLREEWFQITLQIFQHAQQRQQEVGAVLALQTLQGFVQWTTDIRFFIVSTYQTNNEITNGHGHMMTVFWQGLFASLGSAQPAPIQEAALAVLQSWANNLAEYEDDDDNKSGEDASLSLSSLLAPLVSALLQTIHEANFLPSNGVESEAEIEVVIAVAQLLDTLGMQILQWWQFSNASSPSSPQLQTLLDYVFDLFWRALAYDDIDVSGAVLSLATKLVDTTTHSDNQKATKTGNNSNHQPQSSQSSKKSIPQQHILPRLLQILYRQIRYPPDFEYDFTDDIAAEEEIYRGKLDKLYARIVLVADTVSSSSANSSSYSNNNTSTGGLALEFVQSVAAPWFGLSSSTSNGDGSTVAAAHTAPTPDVEATLRLIHHYCEGLKPAPGMKTALNNVKFVALLVSVHSSTITRHPHRQVLRQYYEMAVRYYPLYEQPQNGHLLARLLDALTGSFGLGHPHSQVRSRCCFLLLKTVKSLISLMQPLVGSAVQGIVNLLQANQQSAQLQPEDTFYLFECVGLLLGKTGLAEELQANYLQQVMTPHLHSMKNILAMVSGQSSQSGQHTTVAATSLEELGEMLAHSIAAMAHLSKGFGRKPPGAVQNVLLESLQVTLQVLEALSSQEPIRNKSMVMVQRMIACLDSSLILPAVPRILSTLIPSCTADDVTFVAQVMNQVCIKFKSQEGAAAAALDAALLPFMRQCQALMPRHAKQDTHPTTGVPPHLQTEQLAIQKLSFGVVEHMVTNNATAVLLSPNNAGSLESVLRMIANGAVHVTMDPVIRKTCLHIFRELVEQWVVQKQAPDVCRYGLLTILFQTVLPGTLAAFVDPSFDERDAQQYRIVADFAKLLYLLTTSGETENTLAALHTISARGGGLLDELRSAGDAKAVEQMLSAFLGQSKGR